MSDFNPNYVGTTPTPNSANVPPPPSNFAVPSGLNEPWTYSPSQQAQQPFPSKGGWTYNPALVQQIQQQTKYPWMEQALLTGAVHESGLGTAADFRTDSGGPGGGLQNSYGPWSMDQYGWLETLQTQQGMSYEQAVYTAVDPQLSVAYARNVYEEAWKDPAAFRPYGVSNYGSLSPGQTWNPQSDPNSDYYARTLAAYAEGPGTGYSDTSPSVLPLMGDTNKVKGYIPQGTPGAATIAQRNAYAFSNNPSPPQQSPDNNSGVITQSEASGSGINPNTRATGGGSFSNSLDTMLNPIKKAGIWSFFEPKTWLSILFSVVMRALIAGGGLVMIYFGIQLIVSNTGFLAGVAGQVGGPEVSVAEKAAAAA